MTEYENLPLKAEGTIKLKKETDRSRITQLHCKYLTNCNSAILDLGQQQGRRIPEPQGKNKVFICLARYGVGVQQNRMYLAFLKPLTCPTSVKQSGHQ